MPTEMLAISDAVDYAARVRRGVECLAGGGLVVLPTETVYGIAGRIDLPDARRRLNDLRADPGKPFAIHVASAKDATRYLGSPTRYARRLMALLWPGPVGLMFSVPADVRARVAAEIGVEETDLYDEGQITLRCPDHPAALEVLGAAGGPVALTAAVNDSGPAHRADGLADRLGGAIDLVLDAGPTRLSRPSTLVKVGDGSFEIVRTGVYDGRMIEKMLRTTLLFVCSGNTCRSPMAEALARRAVAERLGVPEAKLEEQGFSVISAGAFAMPGAKATPAAVAAVQSLGADLSAHRSRPLTVELIHQADRIYTMGRAHAAAVTALVPSARNKTHLLSPDGDVDDPIGGDEHLYHRLATELDKMVRRRLDEEPLPGSDA